MRNIIKKKIQKKSKGLIDEFLPVMVFILVMAIILFLFINFNIAMSEKEQINEISRKYVLQMETEGCLKSYESIISDLEAADFYGTPNGGNITAANFKKSNGKNSLTNTVEDTTIVDVGYGNRIVLAFTVYTKNWMLTDGNIFAASFSEEYQPITIVYESTSKE